MGCLGGMKIVPSGLGPVGVVKLPGWDPRNPLNDGWRLSVIRLIVPANGILAFNIFPILFHSSSYYFAIALSFSSSLFFNYMVLRSNDQNQARLTIVKIRPNRY